MTFTQLEIFSVLAKVGSFSRAAAALGITQSGVSHAFKQLESELGVSLLIRESGTPVLTDIGARLLVRANDILQQKEALQQEAGLEQGIARGTLRIASFGATSSLRLLPSLLARFQKAHPLVEVHIDEVVDGVVVQHLLERRVELGFVVLPDERFDTLSLVVDELVAVLPASHPLASKPSIKAQDLHDQPFIRTSAGSGPHIDQFLAAQGAIPKTLFRFEQLSSMMGFVLAGNAVAIAARLALPEPPAGVVYRSLQPRRPREIALAALRFDKLSPAAKAFVEIATKHRKRLQS
ncbi:DNA-binding transcriptional LysR family regulator [Rhodoferax ferrireducens]|uniref:DNA-binding transcriptional LysR family regulator n=1 Tax=Rhodoferax ferrireducens TaxID=192843 RepID=A0ABU2CBE6_9BURK|nr:LysR family transcriptional regulator [Rhodoferax ferrireducens]MDR7378634.1 DNA-binding transcriptional LysR family regulator [Rhodoferax ferrireducens]